MPNQAKKSRATDIVVSIAGIAVLLWTLYSTVVVLMLATSDSPWFALEMIEGMPKLNTPHEVVEENPKTLTLKRHGVVRKYDFMRINCAVLGGIFPLDLKPGDKIVFESVGSNALDGVVVAIKEPPTK